MGILGALEVRDSGGALVEITGARLRAVLVRLAVDAGRPVAAAALIDAVWGDRPPADATNALQTLVSRLRRVLGDPTLVGQSPAGYRLAVEPDDVDAHRFERLAGAGSRALRSGDAAGAAQVLREALDLWRGPALADVAESLQAPAARLDDLRIAAIVDRVSADIALGDAEIAVPELEALSTQFPLDERVAGQLVTALAGSGRQADALRAYERVRERLADELGVDPSAELQAVHLSVLRGEVDSPVRAARRTNLKAQLTSFVGREDELARVSKTLEENRLVTLVGPGGAGKTRLANEAGARLSTPDGVWLAELAPITDPAAVPQAVLGALGFREKQLLDRRLGAPDAVSRLVDVLVDKDVVLVLDNCEHLIDASAQLAEHLLHQCPHLRVLATSREPLGIIGEVVLALPPLGRPPAQSSAARALEYPAVQLFADRGAAALTDFTVDDTNVATVIDIVSRLDGLPLAIELAAARLRTLPVAEIAERLSDRFRLLTGGSRTAMPRHRTLRAVVEWSWELLSEPERRLVERVAVFPAGVVIDSATAVCADDGLPAADVPDLLASLIDKSLLQRAGDSDRLRMLETIREFGVERLSARGELDRMYRRHAEYFSALLRRAEPHLHQADQLHWLDLLTAERDNISAALRYLCAVGDADAALAVANGLSEFSMMLGNHGEITGWVADALAVPGWTNEAERTIARAMYAMNAAAAGRDPDEVARGIEELRDITAHLHLISSAEHPMLGVLRIAIAFFAQEQELTERMLGEELASPDPWVRASAHMFRANLMENVGDLENMREDVALALQEFRRLGERWGLGNTLRSQALLMTMDGDLDGAQAAYEEALDLMAQMKSREDETFLLLHLADIALRRGELDRARAIMNRAYDSAEVIGAGIESVFTLSMLAEFERRSGNEQRARELQDVAMRRTQEIPRHHPALSHGWAIVCALAARFALADGDAAQAMTLAADAYAAAEATRDFPIVAAVGVVLTELVLDSGGSAELAAEMLGATARLRGHDDPSSPDISRITAAMRERLGDDRFAEAYQRGKDLDRDAARKRLDPAEAFAGL